MKKFILNNIWWVSFTIAIVLLITHTLKLSIIEVDSTSIILLLVILISPFVTSIKKIKYGDFEAEIDPKEVEKIKNEAESSSNLDSEEESINEMSEASIKILELAKTDPIIALAKIRIELEKVLKRIARISLIDSERLTLGVLVRNLSTHEVLPQQKCKSLNQVIGICNRAIHGESISEESAETIVNLGVALLEELSFDLELQISSGTIKSEEVITQEELHEYFENKKYRLTTIIPLVENPKKVVRELTQEQLENLLEGYEEYAEFVIGLVEINNG